ncbi:MAG: carbon-nitrogen hydrolase family protein [Anaerolineales bacterium]|nr:MAG: carbon-nitrogen hydrolase family protein [Anaerolineales bacterium]
MKIALIQMVCEKGALQENLEVTAHYITEAAALGIDIVAFPEASLSGYANPQLYPDAVIGLDSPEVPEFLAMTRGNAMTVLAGILEKNPDGKPFITQMVARDGSLVGWQRKMTLGEEKQGQLEDWYVVGKSVNVFTHNGVTFGIAICADMDNAAVFAECARQGASLVFELAAPGLYGDQATRNWTTGFSWWEDEVYKAMTQYTRTHRYWTACATQAGRTVDEDFPGGAFVFAPDGRCVFATEDGTPGAVYLEIDLDAGGCCKIPMSAVTY